MWLWVPGAVGWAVSCITFLLAAAPTELLCARGSLQPCCVAGFTWLHYSVDEEDSNYELESLWSPSPELDFSWFFFFLFFLTVVWQLPLELRFVEVGYINLRFFCLSVYFFFSLSFFIVLRPSDFKGINFLLKPGEKEVTVVGFFLWACFLFLFFTMGLYSTICICTLRSPWHPGSQVH